jgi:hypothetical protein
MSLISIVTENTKDSKFYLNHKKISEELIKFSEQEKFVLNGEYNGFFIKFDLCETYEKSKLEINGIRELTNTSSGLIPVDSAYQEIVNFKIDTSYQNFNDLIFERKTILRKISTKLKNRKSFSLNDKYFIHSKNIRLIEKMKSMITELTKLTEYKLDKFEFKTDKNIEIKFFYFFKSKEEWEKIFKIIFMIKKNVC